MRLTVAKPPAQNETLGHRGGKADHPIYRSRRLLVMADERPPPCRWPRGQATDVWQADRRLSVRSTLSALTTSQPRGVGELATELDDRAYSQEVRRLGRFLKQVEPADVGVAPLTYEPPAPWEWPETRE
jgi:hypothetical protein